MPLKNNSDPNVDHPPGKSNSEMSRPLHSVLPVGNVTEAQDNDKKEAPQFNVPIVLGWRQKLRNLPMLGVAIAWVNAFVRLPSTRKELAMLVHHVDALSQSHKALENKTLLIEQRSYVLEHQKNVLQDRAHFLEQATQELGRQLVAIQEDVQEVVKKNIEECQERLQRYDNLAIGQRLMELDKLHIGRQFRSIKQIMQLQNNLRDTSLTPALVKSNPVETRARTSVDPYIPVNMDQFYVDFEKIFRGSRDDIKQRLTVYIPYLRHLSDCPKEQRLTVVDVGCGRGEWLEMLDEHSIPSYGIDMNGDMVETCLALGLAAECGDAIAYLKKQVPNSVGAVTGFHLIEHLPFEQLLALFDAALHALCPGGVIIFETPNPENMKVGSCNFYFDPTHRNPIVPQVAEFMALQRGFQHAEILRLHPYPENHLLVGSGETEQLLNKVFYGPQDYAVIARKAYAS